MFDLLSFWECRLRICSFLVCVLYVFAVRSCCGFAIGDFSIGGQVNAKR